MSKEADFDNAAVEAFAELMKAKLAASRLKGRYGWHDKTLCSKIGLSRMLRDHVEKGDPVDVANFCMMLSQRDEGIDLEVPLRSTLVDELAQARMQLEKLKQVAERLSAATRASEFSDLTWHVGREDVLAARKALGRV